MMSDDPHDLHMIIRDLQGLIARGDTIDSLRKENAWLEQRHEQHKAAYTAACVEVNKLENEVRTLKARLTEALGPPPPPPRPKSKAREKLRRYKRMIEYENMEMRERLRLLERTRDPTRILHHTGRRLCKTLAMIETAAVAAAQANHLEEIT